MNPATTAWTVACVLGAVLSLKSISVLRARSAWTIAGWALTALYFALAAAEALLATRAPAPAAYTSLALLTIAFVIAGRRDEPQAVPWYWPTTASETGAERRAREKKSDPA